MIVDPADGEPSFTAQIGEYARFVDRMRQEPRQLRSARAVILVCHEDDAACRESWTRDLGEFEVVNGGLWRFGPFLLGDTEALFGAFATLSSTRIMKNKGKEECDSDLSNFSDPPPVFETEMASSD